MVETAPGKCFTVAWHMAMSCSGKPTGDCCEWFVLAGLIARVRRTGWAQVESSEDVTPAERSKGQKDDEKAVLLMHEATSKKWDSFRTRTLSTIFMLGGFVSFVYFGHVFVWALVVLIQVPPSHPASQPALRTAHGGVSRSIHRMRIEG
jgi:hypothetical protein